MGGKASLLLVFSAIFIFSVYQMKIGNVTVRAADNYISYYENTIAHQIAVSGLNIAAAQLYKDPNWRGPLEDIPLSGGSFSIGFGGNADTLEVSSSSQYQGIADTVLATFTGKNIYTQYTLFSANENGVAWVPNDTVWGALHTNGTLNHQNKSSIVFHGKVTAGKGISPPPKNSKTKFLGGYEVGVYLPEVTNINSLINGANSGGYTFPSSTDTMKVEFYNDGTVDVFQNSAKIFDRVALSALSPNGAIYTPGPLVILGGEVNTGPEGLSIGSGQTTIIRDQVYYADDPQINPDSDDLLAIVSWNDILVDNTVRTDWKLQAVLMTVEGSLNAIDMDRDGTFRYYGSIYQKHRGNAKMFQSFMKKYRHDERLNTIVPPYYPGLNSLKLISWWE